MLCLLCCHGGGGSICAKASRCLQALQCCSTELACSRDCTCCRHPHGTISIRACLPDTLASSINTSTSCSEFAPIITGPVCGNRIGTSGVASLHSSPFDQHVWYKMLKCYLCQHCDVSQSPLQTAWAAPRILLADGSHECGVLGITQLRKACCTCCPGHSPHSKIHPDL